MSTERLTCDNQNVLQQKQKAMTLNRSAKVDAAQTLAGPENMTTS